MLNRGERRSLRRAVAQDGLGLLILADADLEAASLGQSDRTFFMDAGWITFPELEGRTVRPQWIDGASPSSVPLPSDPATLKQRFGQAVVIRDGAGGVLAQVASRGAGKVALLTGVETVRWQRHGMNEAYAGFWNRLLSSVTRDPPGVDRWRLIPSAPALVDEQLLLEGRLDSAPSHVAITTPSGTVDSVFLARSGEAAWNSGRYWPREPGWHRIGLSRGEHLFYVYDINAWQATYTTSTPGRRPVPSDGRTRLGAPLWDSQPTPGPPLPRHPSPCHLVGSTACFSLPSRCCGWQRIAAATLRRERVRAGYVSYGGGDACVAPTRVGRIVDRNARNIECHGDIQW